MATSMTSGSPIAGRSTVEPLGGRIAIDARGDGALTLFGRQARSIRGDTCLDERAAAGDEAREDTCPSLNSGAPEELKVLLLLVGRGVAKEDHDESVGTLERLCHPFGGPWWTVKGRGGVEVTDLRLVKGFEGELRGWGGAGGVGWAAGQVDCSRRETARRARAEEGQPCIRMMKSEAPDGFVKVGRDMRRTLLLMLFLLPASSLARDPPRISVREALARGDTAFIGRVVALEELKRIGPYIIHAEAKVVVSRCLFGELCRARALRIQHYPAVADDGMHVTLEFGHQYLFVLKPNAATNGTVEFRTEVTRPMDGTDFDLAFRISGRLQPDFSEDSEPGEFSSLWGAAGGSIQEISFSELAGWASERKLELERSRAAPVPRPAGNEGLRPVSFLIGKWDCTREVPKAGFKGAFVADRQVRLVLRLGPEGASLIGQRKESSPDGTGPPRTWGEVWSWDADTVSLLQTSDDGGRRESSVVVAAGGQELVLHGDSVLDAPVADFAKLRRTSQSEFTTTYWKTLEHRSDRLVQEEVAKETCRRAPVADRGAKATPTVITPRPWEDADLLATMADIAVELDALRRERAGVPPRGVRLEVEFVRASLRRSERPIHFDFGLRPQTKLCLRIEKEGYAPTACQRGTEVPASRARIFDENAPTIVEAQVRFDDEKRLVAVSFIEPIVDDSNWFGPYDVWFLVDAGSDELIAGCIPGYGRADIKAPARHAGEKMSRSCMPFYVRLPDGSAVPWRMAPPEELE